MRVNKKGKLVFGAGAEKQIWLRELSQTWPPMDSFVWHHIVADTRTGRIIAITRDVCARWRASLEENFPQDIVTIILMQLLKPLKQAPKKKLKVS